MDELQGAKNGIAAPDVDLDDIFAENLMDRWNHAGNIEYRQWGARCTAYMSAKSKSGSNTEKRYARGTIRLMKKPQAAKVVAGRPKKEKLIYQHRESAKQTIVAIKKLITSADANSRNDADRDKIIQPLLALYHSISTIRSNEGFSYYLSIYNLISLMIELLETLSYIEDNDARKKAISEILYPKDLGFPEYAEEMTSLGTGKEDDNTEEEESKTEDVPEGRQENRPQDSRYDIHQTFAEIIKAQINASEQSLNELRNEIDGWAQTAVHSDGLVFPARMNDIWNHFFTRCSTITEEARLRARSEDDLVKAGDLFCSYMEAFETSVRLGLPDNTSNTVKDFPLWKALRALSGSNPELNNNLADPANDSSTPAKDGTPTTKSLIPQLKDIINNLNIGPVTQVSPSA